MSSGALDYVCNRVMDAAYKVARQAKRPLHRAFSEHLYKVSKALYALEGVMSSDLAEGEEDDAIRAVLNDGAELEAATEAATIALAELRSAIERSKHTPGPWRAGRPDMRTIVDGVPSKWVYGPEREGGNGYIAVASGTASADWDEVMANARLIAAAPDLLEACEAALANLDYLREQWGFHASREMTGKLRAAVAKANGETDA